jgi:hypothetical protein
LALFCANYAFPSVLPAKLGYSATCDTYSSMRPMNDPDPIRQEELLKLLRSCDKRIGRLTVAVVLMALAVFLLFWANFGFLANYFGGDPLLFGGVAVAAALLGFGSGWFAGRRA